MSYPTPDMFGPRVTAGFEVPRPQLAAALVTALRATTVVHRAVGTVGTALAADVAICEQLVQLSTTWRVALQRAESEAMDKLGVGLRPGAARRLDLDGGRSILIVHGDGWSLVGSTPGVLLFLLDIAPGLVIDRSRAEGAAELVSGLADRLS
ncbi:MAG: hypothetical protein ACRDSP_12295 [Pseudonocardiaceae bacterium]